MNLNLQAALSQEILREYSRLMAVVTLLPAFRIKKEIDGTGGKVSISDMIAYQIGWSTCVIRWYEAGTRQEMPQMPLEGFSKWDYTAIARHFYQQYSYDCFQVQDEAFHQVVTRIVEIVELEYKNGNLDKVGIWPWCKLPSGKEWPLSKWIKVNTSSPYKRATLLIKKGLIDPMQSMHQISA